MRRWCPSTVSGAPAGSLSASTTCRLQRRSLFEYLAAHGAGEPAAARLSEGSERLLRRPRLTPLLHPHTDRRRAMPPRSVLAVSRSLAKSSAQHGLIQRLQMIAVVPEQRPQRRAAPETPSARQGSPVRTDTIRPADARDMGRRRGPLPPAGRQRRPRNGPRSDRRMARAARHGGRGTRGHASPLAAHAGQPPSAPPPRRPDRIEAIRLLAPTRPLQLRLRATVIRPRAPARPETSRVTTWDSATMRSHTPPTA